MKKPTKTPAKKTAVKKTAKKSAPKKSGSPASLAMKSSDGLPGSQILDKIIESHRARRFAMGIQQVLDRKVESYVRINFTEWNANDAEDSRAKSNAEALALLKAAREGEGDDELIRAVTMSDNARAHADAERLRHEKVMTSLAKDLPIAPWIDSVPGLGLLGVATILAETGDLSKYANVAKVWKRLGYAPYNGLAGSTWKRPKWRNGEPALSAEEWTLNPFNGKRYGMLFSISDSLLRKQWIGKAKTEDGKGKADGKYGAVYEKRREHTAVTHPEWTPKHSQMDGLRIMMKEVIKDLWVEWNRHAADGRHTSRDPLGTDAPVQL